MANYFEMFSWDGNFDASVREYAKNWWDQFLKYLFVLCIYKIQPEHLTGDDVKVFLDLLSESYVKYLCDLGPDKAVTVNEWMNEHQTLNLSFTLPFPLHFLLPILFYFFTMNYWMNRHPAIIYFPLDPASNISVSIIMHSIKSNNKRQTPYWLQTAKSQDEVVVIRTF